MGSVVLDTSAFVAWIDRSDAHHLPVVDRLIQLQNEGSAFSISAVTLAELLSVRDSNRRGTARAAVDSLGAGSVLPVSREVAELAGEMRSRSRSLRTPDALIAASAKLHGSALLLTADRKLSRLEGSEYVGVRRR